jgi:hypothetical protein
MAQIRFDLPILENSEALSAFLTIPLRRDIIHRPIFHCRTIAFAGSRGNKSDAWTEFLP